MSSFYDLLQPSACTHPSLNLYCNSITACTGGLGPTGATGATGPTNATGATIAMTWGGIFSPALDSSIGAFNYAGNVTLTVNSVGGTQGVTGDTIISQTALPVQYRPASTFTCVTPVFLQGTGFALGSVSISTGGIITYTTGTNNEGSLVAMPSWSAGYAA